MTTWTGQTTDTETWTEINNAEGYNPGAFQLGAFQLGAFQVAIFLDEQSSDEAWTDL